MLGNLVCFEKLTCAWKRLASFLSFDIVELRLPSCTSNSGAFSGLELIGCWLLVTVVGIMPLLFWSKMPGKTVSGIEGEDETPA